MLTASAAQPNALPADLQTPPDVPAVVLPLNAALPPLPADAPAPKAPAAMPPGMPNSGQRPAMLAPRGTLRQRYRQEADEQAQQADEPEALPKALLDRWAWGLMPARLVQQLAHASLQDGSTSRGTAKLAMLGNSGASAQNCHRDLHRLLNRHVTGAVPTVMVSLPLQARLPGPVVWLDQPYLPLHRVFAALWQRWPAKFMQCVSGPEGAVPAFWAGGRPHDPRWSGWSRFLQGRDLDHCIPLALHGDGVPVFKIGGGKSVEVLSACSLVSRGSDIEIKFLMHCYWGQARCKEAEHGSDTEHCLWEAVAWDLTALHAGQHPAVDHCGNPWPAGSAEAALAGQPLAGPWFAVPWVVRGDMEHFANLLDLEHFGAEQLCPWCNANRTGRPWTDFSEGNAWRSFSWAMPAWHASHPECHPMFRTLGININCLMVDVLHCISLGVAQHVAGNTVHILVLERMHGNRPRNEADLFALLKQWYSAHRGSVQLSNLTTAMYCNPRGLTTAFPCMHKTKGKETEHLALALHDIWPQFAEPGNPRDQSVSEVLRSLSCILTLCRNTGRTQMDGQEHQSLRQSIDSLLFHYTALGNEAAQRGEMRWNMVPKFHYLWHLGDQSQWLHPACGACYVDESFVGRVRELVRAATHGTAVIKASTHAMQRYTRGLLMRWCMEDALAQL